MPVTCGDMIVNVMNLPPFEAPVGVQIKRAFPGDRDKILRFIREHFHEGWALEAETALLQVPGTCFIAEEAGEILGFACYDVSALNFFGPTGVRQDARGRGIGRSLLLACLWAMRLKGYAYAVIGWVSDAAEFYRKTVGATFIPGGDPAHSVYQNMVGMEPKHESK